VWDPPHAGSGVLGVTRRVMAQYCLTIIIFYNFLRFKKITIVSIDLED